jgi:hypothetical protein
MRARDARSRAGRSTEAVREALMRDAPRVVRFLRGRALFRTRPSDVFVASYPRSGTTWLQQILLVLSHDGEREFQHVDDVAPWWERSLALGVRRAADFEALPSPRTFKTHLPHAWLPRGARYLYVRRDGRDVAVSYYHLHRSHLSYEGSFEEFFERFLEGRVQYGSWFKHVAGWDARRERAGVKIVEYERLQSDLAGTMLELDQWLGSGRGVERVEQLAKLCSFEHMKARQERYDHATERRAGRGSADGRFIREGRAGAHREVLSPVQQEAFEAASRRRTDRSHVELDLPAFRH